MGRMSDPTIKRLDEIDFYRGEHEIPGIRFHTAGRQLGVSAWGMNVLSFDPGVDGYPEHDHREDGQEEVYVLLRGSATLIVGDRRWAMEAGTMARVGPETKRKLVPGPEGATVLALGATPGKAYVLRDF
jgi:mannose-6-phosphate isomerase-like protein (cupin superfamily)